MEIKMKIKATRSSLALTVIAFILSPTARSIEKCAYATLDVDWSGELENARAAAGIAEMRTGATRNLHPIYGNNREIRNADFGHAAGAADYFHRLSEIAARPPEQFANGRAKSALDEASYRARYETLHVAIEATREIYHDSLQHHPWYGGNGQRRLESAMAVERAIEAFISFVDEFAPAGRHFNSAAGKQLAILDALQKLRVSKESAATLAAWPQWVGINAERTRMAEWEARLRYARLKDVLDTPIR